MQVKNKVFLYPVLNNNRLYSNYLDSNFEIKYVPEENDVAYVLQGVQFSTDSVYINRLHDEGMIEVYLVVECSDTVFRKAFVITKEPKDITLFKKDFVEKVDISMFAVAKREFNLSSIEFDEEYQCAEYNIDKYDIVCANDGFNIRFKHSEMEDNFVKSIFSIIPSDNIDDGTFEVDCDIGKKITISLSNDDYKNYKIVNTVQTYRDVDFNMLLIPALIEGLTKCQAMVQDSSCDIEDVGNQYLWFRSITISYKRLFGKDLSVDDLKDYSPVLLAQKLMGKPLGKALKQMVNETNRIGEEVGTDE